MGRHSPNGQRPLFPDTTDTLEQLILENIELRQTAADLVLQTAILRESLNEVESTGLPFGRRDS
jgi:hypothetical protein